MSKIYAEDLQKIATKETFNELFKVDDGQFPKLLVLFMQNEVTIETMVILNNIFDFIRIWDKKIMEFVKEFEESRLELFKEMIAEGKGEEKEGMIIIHPEHQQELIDKVGELETIEKNVEVPKINAGELYNIETEEYFPILLDVLLARPEEKTEQAEIVPL